MNRLMISAVLSTIFVGRTSDGQVPTAPVVVSARPVTVSQWTNRVSRELDRRMRYTTIERFGHVPSGIVSIRFHCAEDGRPSDVTMHRGSGTPRLDRFAMRAVGGIKTLHPMPATFRSGQRYQANLLYANSQEELDDQVASLKRAMAGRHPLFGPDKDVVMLDMIPRTSARL